MIKQVAGIRVALIGLDNVGTPVTTTPENVTDLCFRDEFEEYKAIRQQLDGQAEVFVLIIHQGNSSNDASATRLVEKLNALPGRAVDAVIAGHTHFVHDVSPGGVHAIQSGANGQNFGRIDLVYDTQTGLVDRDQTASYAGLRLWEKSCDAGSKPFCDDTSGTPMYEGVAAEPDAEIVQLIDRVRTQITPMAQRKLGRALRGMKVDRINEAPLPNLLTDSLRAASGVEIAMMNSSGIRTDLPAGDISYEQFYRVLPFNNRAVVIQPLAWDKLKALLTRSIQTCGGWGALMQSGLRVAYTRNCQTGSSSDRAAILNRVETLSGEVLFDPKLQIEADASRSFKVGTLDFLAAGGSGYTDFMGSPITQDLGVAREIIADELSGRPGDWSGSVDGRWINMTQPVIRIGNILPR